MTKGNDIEKAFGQVIRELRMAKNISQEKLAEISDLDRSYISDVERGIKTASIVTAIKLAYALNSTPGELFNKLEGYLVKE